MLDDMTREAQQDLVLAELRKHALHCAAAETFQKDRQRLHVLQLASEQEDAHVRRRMHTRAHGSETREQLESMLRETGAALERTDASAGAWNCAAPPGPKVVVRQQIEEDAAGEIGASRQDDDCERAVMTVFRNVEGAERGVDRMEEAAVPEGAGLRVAGIVPRDVRPQSSVGDTSEQVDVDPVSPADARKIVEAERARWRTMLPRVDPRHLYDVGGGISRDSSEPQVAPATPVQGTPMASNVRSSLASTHVSMLSSWSQASRVDVASAGGGSRPGPLGGTVRKDSDAVSSPDGRSQAAWVCDVFQGSVQDGLRLGGLAVLAQSHEELQAGATQRLVDARRAMGAMRKMARQMLKAGQRLLACASSQLEQGAADVNSLSGAHRDAGRAVALLELSASVRLDGWYQAREAEKAALAVRQRADKLLCEMVGPEVAAMAGIGGRQGDAALVPSAVADAGTKLKLSRKEGHGKFTSFLGIPLEVSMLVRELLQEQARRSQESDDAISDERLLADRRLEATGARISQAQLENMRAEWQAEQRLEDAIRCYLSGNLSRDEYDSLVAAEGLQALPTSDAETGIPLPVGSKSSSSHQAPAPAAPGISGSWAYICGRWHFVPPRAAAGLTWKPSHFLQLAEADFEDMRRSSLYALVSVPPYVDGFGRNKKQHWSILAEDQERERAASDIEARLPANLPASHIGCLPAGSRQNWQSATAAPWKASAKVNGSVGVRIGCDAPQIAYDPGTDVLKAIDSLPHGDHLKVVDKPRAPWNSASFALGTAGRSAHWAGSEVTRGRGNERSKAMDEDVRRSVVFAIGEAFRLLNGPSPGDFQPRGKPAGGEGAEAPQCGASVELDLSSMGLDDEYCFLVTHALGHHPSGPVFGGRAAAEDADAEDDLPERLLPYPLEDDTLHVSELRLAHNAVGDCGALDLALALSDVPWRLLAGISAEDGGDGQGENAGVSGMVGNSGMLRKVRTLDLRGNIIGDPGATALSDMLSVNSSLSEVSLADNQIKAGGAEALSRALATNTRLHSLDLSNNLIADEDIAPIAAILSWNSALLRQLPDAGAHAAVNQTLRVLMLGRNSLGDAGSQHIAAAIASHPTLVEVGLEDNGIGDDGAAAIRQALQLRRSGGLAAMHRVSLARNAVTEDGFRKSPSVSAAVHLAESREVLKMLDLQGNAGLSEPLVPLLQAEGIGQVLI